MPPMPVETMNKHELRTRETRALLLEAAEKIFVRDGYESAELGEIAALAGRTKGAIYAQFKSKEDIFLALMDVHRDRTRAQMEKLLAESTTIEGNLKALRTFYLKRAEDQAWALLLLEFKLFAMRHPTAMKKLKSLYEGTLSVSEESRFAGIIGPAAKGKNSISRVTAIQALQPAISGLVLEAQLDTTLTDKETMKKVVNRIFDALLNIVSQ
jgi:AcrR family transcriptional regulator